MTLTGNIWELMDISQIFAMLGVKIRVLYLLHSLDMVCKYLSTQLTLSVF